MTLTFDLFTLKPVRFIAHDVGKLDTSFDVSGFSFSNNGPTLVRLATWPCDFDLWPWRSWQLSAMRVFVLHQWGPSWKFISLSVRKIWRNSGLSISRPVDIDFWSLTLKLVCIITRGMGNLPTSYGVSVPFRSRLISCDTHYVTLRPWPLTSEVTARSRRLSMIGVFVLCLCTKFEFRSPSNFEDIVHLLCEH